MYIASSHLELYPSIIQVGGNHSISLVITRTISRKCSYSDLEPITEIDKFKFQLLRKATREKGLTTQISTLE